MGGVVSLPLDIVDNFIILTVSVVFVINHIYLSIFQILVNFKNVMSLLAACTNYNLTLLCWI